MYICKAILRRLPQCACVLSSSMSQSEEQWSHRPPSTGEVELEEQEEKGKRIEEDTPLVAMAPDASFPEERPSTTDIYDCSPAFQCLNEVCVAFSISCDNM